MQKILQMYRKETSRIQENVVCCFKTIDLIKFLNFRVPLKYFCFKTAGRRFLSISGNNIICGKLNILKQARRFFIQNKDGTILNHLPVRKFSTKSFRNFFVTRFYNCMSNKKAREQENNDCYFVVIG